MIFYPNHKNHKQTQEKNLIFSIFGDGITSDVDNSVAKPAQCEMFYNLSVVDGALKTGLGFEDLTVPASTDDLTTVHGFDFASKIDKILGVWVYRWVSEGENNYQLLMLDSNYKVWAVLMIDPYSGFVIERSRRLKSFPTYCCTYRFDDVDSFVLFSKEGMVLFSGVMEGIYDQTPPMISCVVHYDNFFGVTNTNLSTLIYTKNLDLRNWQTEQSSAVEFMDNRGGFTKLVSFNDYVYLFREYGITKISIYTSKSDFAFTHLYTSTSKIFEDSVCVCGENVLFLTREGLCSFNGNSVNRVAEDYNKIWRRLDNTHVSTACLNGKYYVATRLDFDDGAKIGCENESGFVNNVLLEIDIENFDLQIYRGVDIVRLASADTPYFCKLVACFNGQHCQRVGQLTFGAHQDENFDDKAALDNSSSVGKTFGQATEKFWKSYSTDLDFPGRRKKVKEIMLTTKGDVTMEIASDEETKTYTFEGGKNLQKIAANVVGKTFKFSFYTNSAQCEIEKPVVVFDVV